jgi:hypothetical protein
MKRAINETVEMDPLTFVIGGVLLILLMAALTQPKDPPP